MNRSRLRRLGGAAIAVTLVWCVVVLYGFQSQNEAFGRIPLDGYLTRVVEQGWGFFTRSPREAASYLYLGSAARHPDGLWPPVRAAAADAFGISRAAWAYGNEIDYLSLQLPRSAWQPCHHGVEACAGRRMPVVPIVSTWRPATICGSIVLLRARALPWDQRAAEGIDVVQVARAEVRC